MKTTTKTFVLLVSFCSITLFTTFWSFPLSAQESQTDSTGETGEPKEERNSIEGSAVDVPPVVFEYDSPPRRDLDVLLPEGEPLSLPEIEPSLPVPEEMEITFPDIDVSPPIERYGEALTERSFFSEGRIGVGIGNHLLGDISLYKRGDYPHFSVGFSHEGLDGYGNKSSGEGYFHRIENLTAGMSGDGEKTSWDITGEYQEKETGFQSYQDASSLIHRFSSSTIGGRLSLGENAYIEAEGYGHYGTRTIAGMTGGEDTFSEPIFELYLVPEGRIVYTPQWGRIEGMSEYSFYRGKGQEDYHSVRGGFELSYFFAGFDMWSSFEALWNESEGLLFPFSLGAEGIAGEDLRFRIEGGYEARRNTYRQLWFEYPFLDRAEEFPLTHGWWGETELGGRLGEKFEWNILADFHLTENYPMPRTLDEADGGADESDGLFPLDTEDTLRGGGEVALTYNFLESLRVEGTWRGDFAEELVNPRGRHSFSAKLIFDRAGEYGAEIGGAYRLEPTSALPEISTEGYYRLSEGVVLRFEWSDVLSPLIEGGRRTWGEYLDSGMQLRLVTEISL